MTVLVGFLEKTGSFSEKGFSTCEFDGSLKIKVRKSHSEAP